MTQNSHETPGSTPVNLGLTPAGQFQHEAARLIDKHVLRLPEDTASKYSDELVELIVQAAILRANPFIQSVSKMELKTGDCLVMKSSYPLSDTDFDFIKQFMKRIVPVGVKVGLLAPGLELEIIRQESE
jgi:hypothetical protein